jgi:hypothetical protein
MCKPKRYWRVEILNGSTTIFRKYVPGNLSDEEVATILQRLASRDLTPREVMGYTGFRAATNNG